MGNQQNTSRKNSDSMKYLFHFYDLSSVAGIQRAICELANALVEQGNQVVIATNSARSESAYPLDDRVSIEKTPYPEERRYERLGILAWPFKMLWAIRQIGALRTVVKRHNPSLIVDHGTSIGLTFPFGTIAGAPLVLQRHFPVRNFPRGEILYRLLALLCGGRSVVVLTESIAADLRRLGYRRVTVIPNMIPARATARPYSDAVPKTGLLIGRAHPQKGFDLFLKALCQTDMDGWQFTIMGPQVDSEPTLKGLVCELGLGDRVLLLPARNDPYEQIRKASVVIMPSRYEGFPMVALEALGIGRPLIASDVDGLRDVVSGNINGLVFPCGDVEKLSGCLRRIRDEADLLPTLAQNSRAGIERYRKDSVVGKWESLAAELANANA